LTPEEVDSEDSDEVPFGDTLEDDLEELVRHEVRRRNEAPVPRSLLDFLDE
jgi:hypothetical protein